MPEEPEIEMNVALPAHEGKIRGRAIERDQAPVDPVPESQSV